MAKRMGLEDIIRDVVSNIGTGGATRPKKLLKRKQPAPAMRTKPKGSYRDQLADANRFGGKRPERKVVKTLMSYPPINVYNDGSRERVVKNPYGGDRRKPARMPKKTEPPRRKRPPVTRRRPNQKWTEQYTKLKRGK